MEFSAEQLAEVLGGKVDGNAEQTVSRLSKIEEGGEGSLSFLANPAYEKYIYETTASVVIVSEDFTPTAEISATLVRVPDAYGAFAKLLEMYNQMKGSKSGREEPSYIHDSVSMPEEYYLGAFAYIGANSKIGNGTKIHPHCHIADNVTIGENCEIFAGVKIYGDCVIGNNVTIHAGTVIGADGFGFAPNSENSYDKVAQIGNVIIEDHVEIGANSTIDRATLGSTIIRKGVKLDNLIQVAHNVEIGENTVIAAQTGVAGSTKIGKNCMIGGQVGIVGHLTIGNGVKIAAQSGVPKSMPDNAVVQGSPAFDYIDYNKSYAVYRKLPQLAKEIHQLKKNLES
ncbi:MAG: UDP-3-O-(3-hydroxymyristoyl)glucosamine N-acyltransferase [Flavobacteriia bacterium]|nr:UDP-3-O-(3-hydroxymyristoyl)glucosamine N-acyltransferase [Flavobacteriia bacterium]